MDLLLQLDEALLQDEYSSCCVMISLSILICFFSEYRIKSAQRYNIFFIFANSVSFICKKYKIFVYVEKK